MTNKKPDFSNPANILDFFYKHFGYCICVELEEMIDEIKRLLWWCKSNKHVSYRDLYDRPGTFYLVIGLLELAGLVEHGVSIRTGFLTELGQELLDALNKFTVKEFIAAGDKA